MVSTPAVRMLAGGLALALLFASHSLPSEAQAREYALYVNAFERQTRQPVETLGPRDIEVREDGVAREVLSVERAKSPMPVALVVDNTQAATSAVADIRRAVSGFFNAVQGVGPVALITVADRPTIVVDYTTVPKSLQDGVGRLFAVPGSGARLLDTIRDTARGLARREADRAAMVLLTTEHIEFSTLHYTQVLEAVKESGVQMHAVVLVNSRAADFNDEARNRAAVLDRGPRESGGLRMDVLASSAFDSQLLELANILKSQFRVVYGRPETLIPPDRVDVSALREGIEVRGSPARGQGK
jgi:hypothetical protein